MKTLKLKPGFLVNDWDGEITPIDYVIVNYSHYGNEKFLFADKDGVFQVISKWSDDKIFDSLEEAEKHSKIKKKERIAYCEKQIKEYTERLKEYQEA